MYSGGVIGAIISSDATVSDCVNNATVVGTEQAGGIVGCAYNSYGSTLITNCINNGNISDTGNFGAGVGGIVGFLSGYASSVDNKAPTLTYCTNNGTITGKNRAGGIAGTLGTEGGYEGFTLSASFTKCVNYGTVNGTITGDICMSKLHYNGSKPTNLTIIIDGVEY